jgi:predicted RNase H-like nuclease (RuvC/YqgF family)
MIRRDKHEGDTYTVAVDPGLMTGLAVWDHRTGEIDWDLTGEYAEDEFYEIIWTLAPDMLHLRIETFAITQRTLRSGRQYESLWFTGFLKFMAYIYRTPTTYSAPADVMEKFPDKALKQAGWYSKSEHARDALRHLAACLIHTKVISARGFIIE